MIASHCGEIGQFSGGRRIVLVYISFYWMSHLALCHVDTDQLQPNPKSNSVVNLKFSTHILEVYYCSCCDV